MVDLIIKETTSLRGKVRAPPSKSITHRAFIASALSEGLSVIEKPLICDDTLATIDACRMLGAEIKEDGEGKFHVQGRSKPVTPEDIINCRDSASTIRFVTPICALADGISVLTGGAGLRRRPMEPILEALSQLDVRCYSARGDGRPPLIVFGGGIKGGETSIRGDVSSQFISGLLFAAPLAKSQTDIILSAPLESRPYVAITLDILDRHGVKVQASQNFDRFKILPGQRYMPCNHIVEGDYSSASFLLAAAAITNSTVTVENLRADSLQGDRFIVELLEMLGVQTAVGKDSIQVLGIKHALRPIDVNLSDNPDLVPPLVVMCCFASGKSTIRGVKRLRFKESDRLASLISELTKMGAKVKAEGDAIVVDGGKRIHGAELESRGDHRIAMACVVAGLKAEGTTVVHGIECINKSYPDFVKDIVSIGGHVIER